jgi:hypothetical protein
MLRTKSQILLDVIFFLLCYFYVWIFIKPYLIYHGFGTIIPDVPLFSTGLQFLKDSLSVPGGLITYAYGFISQWYYYSWLGALLVTLAALFLCELSRRHFIYVGCSRLTVLHYLPAVMIILTYNQYSHPLAACLTSAIGLLLSLFFERMPLRRAPIRMAVFCLIAAICYSLAGAGAVLVFSLMTAVYSIFLRRDWSFAVLTIPAAAAIIWTLAEYVFYMSPKQAFLVLTPFSRDMTIHMKTLSRVSVIMLYVFVPVTALTIFLCRTLFCKIGNAHVVHSKKAESKKARAIIRSPGEILAHSWKVILPVFPMVMMAVGLYLSYDKTHRQIVLMNCLARQGRWSEVLELGNRMPKNVYNIYCNHDINRALYHAGRLGYDMLCFPQNPHALLLTHENEESSMTQLKMCDTYIELGNIDYAEKLASEFLVDKGTDGAALEKLAWINIIKEQEHTAQIYLNALKKDLIYCDKADSMLKSLKNGFEPDEAAYIRRLNSYIRKNGNERLIKESIEEMLTGLIEHNPGNRMAFEYLMACYLLAGQLEKIAENIWCLNNLGYQEIPTLYEEAMLIYYGSRGEKLNLSELNIKRETIERYKKFVLLCNSIQVHNRQAVLQQMIRQYGTSYLFYYYQLKTSIQAQMPLS